MLNPKENYLLALNHKPTQYPPADFLDSGVAGNALEIETGPIGGGYDAFGVKWTASASSAIGVMPAPGQHLLNDITEWKKVIVFPNLKEYDWQNMADAALAQVNRDTQVLIGANFNCVFERLVSFMGFENALVAMMEEPEAVYEFFEELTDWKIEVIKYYKKYVDPDVFQYFDDLATERSLFMSPEVYRKLIKPHHKRICDEIKSLDMIPMQHTCGKAEGIVEDLIEIGVACWQSVQPTNDIEGLIEKYGDQITFDGGYNVNGAPGYETATEEEIRTETIRCLESYGRFNKGYIFQGAIIRPGSGGEGLQGMFAAMQPIFDEVMKSRAALSETV